MKKTFPLEEVLTFTSGRVIALTEIHPLDVNCYLYQIANVVTGRVNEPLSLMMDTDLIRDQIMDQFPEITDWNIGAPAGGWDSVNQSLMGDEVALANKKAFIAALCQKFNRTELELEGPDSVEESHHGIMVVEL